MRITQGHLYARAIEDVNRGLRDYVRLQEQIATGRRVNRPSDDPVRGAADHPAHQRHPAAAAVHEQRRAGARHARPTARRRSRTRRRSCSGCASSRRRPRTARCRRKTAPASARRSTGLLQPDGRDRQQQAGQPLPVRRHRDQRAAVPARRRTAAVRASSTSGNHDRVEISVAPGVRHAVNIAGERDLPAPRARRVTITGSHGRRATGGGDTAVGFQDLAVTFAGLAHGRAVHGDRGHRRQQRARPPRLRVHRGPPATLSIGGGPAVPIPATDTNFATSDGRVLSTSTVTGAPATLNGHVHGEGRAQHRRRPQRRRRRRLHQPRASRCATRTTARP